MKILFDASVHLGQFCLTSEEQRIGCKNSQVAISTAPNEETIGVVSFNENSWSDHVIWGLDRETQDIFYKFMDVFHSIKNIERIPLTTADAKMALEFSAKYEVSIDHALSAAVAVRTGVQEIHSCDEEFLKSNICEYLKQERGIDVRTPIGSEESAYDSVLEQRYQTAMERFRCTGIDPTALLPR